MTHEEALVTLGGNRPLWELRNIVRALQFHPWLNNAEERARLEAARLMIRHTTRKRKRK